jgi:Dolichyl-phosphate-mannose-protein mannosyltransferase
MKKVKHRPGSPPPNTLPEISPYGAYAAVLIVVLFFGLIRFRLRDMPLERDEGEYAYAAQLILQGIPPYQLAYNMKFPGTYVAYAGIMGLLGQTTSGIHLGLILVNAATTILVFLLTVRLFGRFAGIIGSASYALLSTSESVLGFAAHATHFVVFFALGGILLLLKAVETRRTWLYFGSGLLLGLGLLMKQPGVFFVLFAALYLLRTEPQDPIDWRGLATRLGIFCAGAILPFALTCLWLWRAGVLGQFWFWTFRYASQYASSNSVLVAWPVLQMVAPGVLSAALWMWLIAGVGLVAFLWTREARSHATFVIGLLLFSFLAVCPGFYFRGHYFILLLPVVAVLDGFAVSATRSRLYEKTTNRLLAFIPVLLFLGAFGYSLAQEWDFFSEKSPEAACRSIYAPNPFPEAIKVARYIRDHTPESARIAVLGSEPEIYFYSRRHSATGYIYTYELMEEQKFAAIMQEQMIHDIEAAQPEYVVYVDVPFSWFVRPRSETRIFSWAKDYLQQYERVGLAEIERADTTYHWDADAKAYTPRSSNTVQVFKRRKE